MATFKENLTELRRINADLYAATREKDLDPSGVSFAQLHELWAQITSGSGNYQTLAAIPAAANVELIPNSEYEAIAKVIIEAALNAKSYNIRDGVTMFGIEGSMKIAVSSDIPDGFISDNPENPDPGTVEDAENEYRGNNNGEDPPEDMFILLDNNGNRTYGYLTENFEITYYDPDTTEFCAKGWIRESYHTTGDKAGQWSYDSWIDEASTGWNYFKHLISCTRDKLWYNGVEIWPKYGGKNAVATAITTLPAVLPDTRAWMGCATVGNKIYLVGGASADVADITSATDTADIIVFDPIAETFEVRANVLPRAMGRVCTVAVGRKLYLFGGLSGLTTTYGDIYTYDVDTGVLTKKFAKTANLAGMLGHVSGDYIYLIGGVTRRVDAGAVVGTIQRYHIPSDTLVTLDVALPYPAYENCIAAYGKKVYIFGGYVGGESGITNIIQVFDVETETVSILNASMSNASAGHQCTAYGRKITIAGGEIVLKDGANTNIIYSMDAKAWETVAAAVTLPAEMSHFSFGRWKDRVYVFGGWCRKDLAAYSTIHRLTFTETG